MLPPLRAIKGTEVCLRTHTENRKRRRRVAVPSHTVQYTALP